MKANPDKFQAIAVGKRTQDKSSVFKLGDANEPCEEVVKLFGVDIPLPARLMSIADVFDALISRRVYKEPYEFEKSVSMIIEMSGSYFDPQIVESFKLVIEDFRNVAIKYKE